MFTKTLLMLAGLSLLIAGCAIGRSGWVGAAGCQSLLSDTSSTAWTHCDFTRESFEETDFTEARFITGSNFFRADLQGANLSRVMLYQNEFFYVDLREADLHEANLYLSKLDNALLNNSNLEGVFFWQTDLSSADLSGASLTKAYFKFADATNANFTGANLTDALLYYTDISGANFTDADLTGASMQSAVQKGLTNPTTFCRTTMPDGSINNEGC
jgi:uncharacterized protein YjbI with pentapeptide repeats